jgi:putative sigma-54 modulation protein
MFMKVIYTGKTKDFTPQLERKVEGKLTKLGKMVDRRGEQDAHLFHRQERHLHMVEVKMNFYDHALCGAGSDGDLVSAVTEAVDKLEKQIVRRRTKWRDTSRDPKATRESKEQWGAASGDNQRSAAAAAPPASPRKPPRAQASSSKRIYKVAHGNGQKPMSLEEAVLAMDDGSDYVVYRDSDRDKVSVLLRRRDGHFDLIEA